MPSLSKSFQKPQVEHRRGISGQINISLQSLLVQKILIIKRRLFRRHVFHKPCSWFCTHLFLFVFYFQDKNHHIKTHELTNPGIQKVCTMVIRERERDRCPRSQRGIHFHAMGTQEAERSCWARQCDCFSSSGLQELTKTKQAALR